MKKNLHFILTVVLLINCFVAAAQSINVAGTIRGFRHNWDCCNDGVSVGCVFANYPDPRYKVWVGWDGANFSQSTNNPGLYCGASDYTYGADGEDCTTWNPGDITLPTLTGNMSTYNVDMQSWEDDGCGSNCVPDGPSSNPFDACFYNADDTRCGRLRIGDISLCSYAPCTNHTFNGDFQSGSFLSMHNRCGDNNGAGYGINQLVLNWSFNAAPTITFQPTDASLGGSPRSTCENIALSLEVRSNTKCSWTLARWVRWEESTDNVTWTAIAGTDNSTAFTTQTTFAYNPVLPNAAPGSPLIRYYRAVLVSACAKPTTDAGWRISSLSTISEVMQVTIYDPSDAFCTAPQCNIMYVDPVSGNDVNAGSPVLPKQTISGAAAPGVTYIRVAKCVSGCTDAGVVNIPNNCVIEGGYVRSGGSNEIWTKSSATADETNITFSGAENAPGSDNSIRHIVAFKADAKTGWTVKDLNITTANTPASTFSNNGRGMSNYGMLIINNSANYNVVRCKIVVGNAGLGIAGTTPAGRGGAASTGGAGGTAGNGATGCGDPTSGATGTAGNGGAAGGTGSDIGSAGGCRIYPPRGNCSSGRPSKASAGSTGGNATTSYAINDRPTAVVPTNNSYYIPATQSASGSNGFGGGGGGGGGGSRGGQCGTCFNCDGNGGGVGATGGNGGLGGTGGFGGGGVFGIWRYSSSTGSNIQDVNCTLGNAGLGGDGAAGQLGALLVSINNGNTGGSCVCGNPQGGSGGDGGAGGNGGRGRDGANGTTAQIVTDGATSTPGTSYTNASNANVTLDNATKRTNVQGKMCRFSQIDMAAGTLGAGWVLPAGGLSFLDTTSFGASYTNAQPTVSVTTDNANSFFNIAVNGGTLQSYLYTSTELRTLPTINPTSPTELRICDGVSQTFTITNSFEPAEIQDRQWVLYQRSGGSGQTLTFVESSNSSSYSRTFTTSSRDSFVVRYRERHKCCGWSRPVFKNVYVYKKPTFTVSSTIPICSYTSGPYAELSATETSNLSNLTYVWVRNSGTGTISPASGSIAALGTINTTVTGLTGGTTTQVQLTVTNVGCSETITEDLLSNSRDDANISTDTLNCYTCSVVNGNIYKYYDNSGKLVAQLEDMTGSPYSSSSLGNTEICIRIPTPNIAPTPLVLTNAYLDGMPYLRRYWSINPTVDNLHARVTLYFNDAELTDLANGSSTTAYAFAKASYAAALRVTKFPGGGALTFTGPNNIFTNNTTSGGENVVTGGYANSHPTWTGASFASSAYGGGNYQVSFIVDQFSTFYIHPVRFPYEVLPVELTSFTGYNEGIVNKLQWSTSSEKNTVKFEVEKSIESSNWSLIGEISAAGNSTTLRNYDFNDNNPVFGNNYYRLKIIDLDGTFTYSNVINIPINTVTNNSFVQVYPNPTKGILNIDVQSTSAYDINMITFDVLGKKVLEKSMNVVKGLNTLSIDYSTIAKGTYILQYSDGEGKLHTTKFVKD